MLSITTDYARSTDDPSPSLRRIAEAGFSHVHWCHQWNTDFLYSKSEVDRIAAWLADFGLSLLDLHGSVGPDKDWTAIEEYRRLAGVDLVRNRLEMAARLGGGSVIMHAGPALKPPGPSFSADSLRRSLDELESIARDLGVRIAIENGNWPRIQGLLGSYAPDYLGLCYDSGHGNLGRGGLSELEALKDRLVSIHLHDNQGREDEHRLPFTGTVDWPRLAGILASSAYAKCVSLESNMGHEPASSEEDFLARAFTAGKRLQAMIAEAREGRRTP